MQKGVHVQKKQEVVLPKKEFNEPSHVHEGSTGREVGDFPQREGEHIAELYWGRVSTMAQWGHVEKKRVGGSWKPAEIRTVNKH